MIDIFDLRSRSPSLHTSIPSICIVPLHGSTSLNSAVIRLLLPLPVLFLKDIVQSEVY
jgi:hypothetical protein